MILVNGKYVDQKEWEQKLRQEAAEEAVKPLNAQLAAEQVKLQEQAAQLEGEYAKVRGLNEQLEAEEVKYHELSRQLDGEQRQVALLTEELSRATDQVIYDHVLVDEAVPSRVTVTSLVPFRIDQSLDFPWGEGKWWPERNALIAGKIPPDASVLDLGGGLCRLAEAVTGRYVSLDRERWTNLTVRADFNLGEYPDVGYFDELVCQGVLEYLTDPGEFLKVVRKYGERLLLTYQLGSGEGRNDLTFDQLEALLEDAAWKILDVQDVDSASQRLYVCERATLWNELKAYWWGEGRTSNWGDVFTSFLARKRYRKHLQLTDPEHAQLFGCGSILEHIPVGYDGWVLGAGLQYANSRIDLSGAKGPILVRGKLTATRVNASGSVALGDPGLLISLFVEPVEKRHELGIIPHYADKQQGQVAYWAGQPGVKVIDVEAGVLEVAREVTACRQVVSSSLHGLVVADSLGVPNRWVVLSGDVAGLGFKFYDYYSAYGEEARPAASLREAAEGCVTRDVTAVRENVLRAYEVLR